MKKMFLFLLTTLSPLAFSEDLSLVDVAHALQSRLVPAGSSKIQLEGVDATSGKACLVNMNISGFAPEESFYARVELADSNSEDDLSTDDFYAFQLFARELEMFQNNERKMSVRVRRDPTMQFVDSKSWQSLTAEWNAEGQLTAIIIQKKTLGAFWIPLPWKGIRCQF